MGARGLDRYEADRRLRQDRSCVSTLDNRIKMENMRRGRDQDVDRSGACVRMRPLHVHNALVFRSFQFRKMRVQQRSLTRTGVHMEKRGI